MAKPFQPMRLAVDLDDVSLVQLLSRAAAKEEAVVRSFGLGVQFAVGVADHPAKIALAGMSWLCQ